MKRIISYIAFFVFVAILYNHYSREIWDFNASIRNYVIHGNYIKTTFDEEGIPSSDNPRHSEPLVSPFYVVHYGLAYSETCQDSNRSPNAYHWRKDTTSKYWPQPTQKSVDLFRSSAEWLYKNIDRSVSGRAHFLYDFEWRYVKYKLGTIRPPWWSGLTDGHAITLFLRAYDCFGEDGYLKAAEELYRSVTTPFSEGGSLIYFNGHPWIEEYVDPRGNESDFSRVLNGMVYAYLGVRGYEEYIGKLEWAPKLKASLEANIGTFDQGYWSFYDALGGSANIKYHSVNLSLLEDSRIYDSNFDSYIYRWNIGRILPIVFFSIYGPNSIAKYHYVLQFIFISSAPLLAIFLIRCIRRRR